MVGGDGYEPLGVVNTSFKTIYNDLFRFRKSYTKDNSDGSSAYDLFRAMDQPGHYYFKLFFYFDNPYSDPSNPLSSNLLGTSYHKEDAKPGDFEGNTALNYLYNNLEYTRFSYLSEFIQLLSDVSTNSPWYFQQISGLDTALDRQEVGTKEFKMEDDRKQITIKCMPDAYDNRIGRLLDLYRAVVWSQTQKKWILPRNLRKFDMGLYIFNSPIKTITGGRYGLSGDIADRVLETTFKEYYGDRENDSGNYESQMYKRPSDIRDPYLVGSKYIEFRGCEIDYNSSKTAYSDMDNAEGKQMEYEITVKFDSAFEDRYDPIFVDQIGDFVIEDIFGDNSGKLREENPYSYIDKYDEGKLVESTVGDPFGAEKGSTLLGTAIGMGEGMLNTFVNKLLLGNVYGFSLSRLDNILTSDPMSALIKTGKEINNAALIKKRITDFTDPNRGTRILEGKNIYNGWERTERPSSLPKKIPGYGTET